MVLIVVSGCAGDDAPSPEAHRDVETPEDPGEKVGEQAQQRFPDVVDARLSATGDGHYEIVVTISSPYDSPERYADGWRVLDPQGEVLAEHDLAHDHADEQPFTRTRGPFTIPEHVTDIIVEGRDLEHGYGGETVTIDVPR